MVFQRNILGAVSKKSVTFWILLLFIVYTGWFLFDETILFSDFSNFPLSLFIVLCCITFLSFFGFYAGIF